MIHPIMRKPILLIPILVVLSLFFWNYTYYYGAWAPQEVLVLVGPSEIEVQTRARNVASVLQEAGIEYTEEYDIYPTLDSPIQGETIIEVIPPSEVIVVHDGEEKNLWTQGAPVAQLLERAQVEITPLDLVEPSLDTFITSEALIRITRIIHEDIITEEAIPHGRKQREDPTLEKGKTRIVQQGQDGIRQKTLRKVYADGELVEERVINQKVTQAPLETIVAMGTKIVIRTMTTPQGPIRYREVLQMEATAYYPGPESTGIWADGYTATGTVAGHGVAAVDPRMIPLGTNIYIPGYGVAEASDVGGAIKGNIIDLCFDTYREAIHFGRRPVSVYVLE